ncbi:iron complex outermembrane recepter protein [Loktanella fryxellensis]|uniref:Iron complex outermembrane recepter protein n=1 Tax=Loktanella fryxellensis TaxID=245187 RepID=A0A1H8IPC5_9RHOB|nr:iron complex outermembrane recepter protein [Loktanella fryxellensis]
MTTQRQAGLYFQDQIHWRDGWIGTVNLRHVVKTGQDGVAAFKRDDSETAYRVALARELANGLTPYMSVSSFFNPLLASPASSVIDPESGEQAEVGLTYAPE